MSLLLLFNPSPTPANTETIGPAVVQFVEVTKPSLYDLKTISPALYTIDLDKISLKSVEKVLGEFENSTVEYSSASVAYSSSAETYGGMDRVQPVQASMDSIDQATPNIYSIEKV